MASLPSTSPAPMATVTGATLKATGTSCSLSRVSTVRIPLAGGLRLSQKAHVAEVTTRLTSFHGFRTRVSCALAQPETLQAVQSTIAKQLSIDECTVTPQTKFADLGADSLDTVEIMMALEEKFGVSIGEGGAENISTVQEAADLIENVKAEAA